MPVLSPVRPFVDSWRRAKSAAFDLRANSTGRGTVAVDFGGSVRPVYANANLSVYSAQACNARCAFCVEELRPASRGRALAAQKRVETDDALYFGALERTLDALAPLGPTASVTGGEASLDPRLPRILRTLQARALRRRTMTTNGSGLLEVREGRRVLDWAVDTGLAHLNISRASVGQERNARLMGFASAPAPEALERIISCARAGGTRPRLSCLLLDGEVDSLSGVLDYLAFARSLGADNVIFRQVMLTDPATHADSPVVRYCEAKRALLEPILDAVSADPSFEFVRQVVGYYYYVEVWRREGVDVVFEEADLARLERTKLSMPGIVHELVFHPDGSLASTWQPGDGVLMP